jgi:hypothetical protein
MQLMELKEVLQKKLSAPNIRTSKEKERDTRIRCNCRSLSAVLTDTILHRLAAVDSPYICSSYSLLARAFKAVQCFLNTFISKSNTSFLYSKKLRR